MSTVIPQRDAVVFKSIGLWIAHITGVAKSRSMQGDVLSWPELDFRFCFGRQQNVCFNIIHSLE